MHLAPYTRRFKPTTVTSTVVTHPTYPADSTPLYRMGKSESQMDIMEKSSKPGKHRWSAAEIGLSVLLLLVSCALVGLIVLYTAAVRGKSRPANTHLTLQQGLKSSQSPGKCLSIFVAGRFHTETMIYY